MAIKALSNVSLDNKPYKKEVKYLNKDFSDFKSAIIDFAKFYFPDSYQDFNESSPGSIFIEMAAYIGDVLSYYTDHSFKENLLAYAEEKENIIALAQGFGYKVKATTPAYCTATISQLAPADVDGNLDTNYLLRIGQGSTFSSDRIDGVNFVSDEIVDFQDSTDRNVTVYSLDEISGLPTSFLITKPVKLVAARRKTFDYVVTDPTKFLSFELPDVDVIDVENVEDSDGNTWHQVDVLSQDYIFRDILVSNNTVNSPLYEIKKFKATRRFVVRLNRDVKTEIMFGSGTGELNDVFENIDYQSIYNSKYLQYITNTPLDILNFTNSNSFGLAPGNTTLTVTYLVGGGVQTNTPSNTINVVDTLSILNETRLLTEAEQSVFNSAKNSVSIINPEPATGGGDPPSIEQIRKNAIGYLHAQGRVVTVKDYEDRTLSMPAKYGTVAKSFVVRDEQINTIIDYTRVSEATLETLDPEDDILYVDDRPVNTNINLYILGFDRDKKITTLNNTVKRNLKIYLNEYRMLTDKVNIIDGFVVNIGVEYNIIVYKTYNLYDVLARVSDRIKNFFDIDRWEINQPIIIPDLEIEIASVDGVQSVLSVEIFNKYQQQDGSDYVPYRYNIPANTVGKIVYPSADPCIFELRYPESDIIGTATQ